MPFYFYPAVIFSEYPVAVKGAVAKANGGIGRIEKIGGKQLDAASIAAHAVFSGADAALNLNFTYRIHNIRIVGKISALVFWFI